MLDVVRCGYCDEEPEWTPAAVGVVGCPGQLHVAVPCRVDTDEDLSGFGGVRHDSPPFLVPFRGMSRTGHSAWCTRLWVARPSVRPM